MLAFDFATAARIRFGEGAVREVPAAAAAFGSRALIVTGGPPETRESLLTGLRRRGVECVALAAKGEPTLEFVRSGAEQARAERCDMVIAIGGGSAIDAGQALAALLTNQGDPLDYLEVIGAGKPLARPSAPFIAIPTTAGTGSEVTRNAVVASPERGVKASLRSPWMLPALTVVDPEITLSLPPAVSASTGLDALTQLIEPYVSSRANAMTDLYCVEGIRTAAWALPRVWRDGRDREARAGMAWASLLGGLSLANAGLGAVHGIAAPLGGMFPAPHGAVCAALLPHVMRANLQALKERAPRHSALVRYEEVARLLTGSPHATAEEGIDWVESSCREFQIPPLRNYGVSEAHIEELAEKASRASSMKTNPIALTIDELRRTLAESLMA